MAKFIDKVLEFLRETEIHGVKHILNHRVSTFRRILWLLGFLASSIFLFALVITRFHRAQSNPTSSKVETYLADVELPRVMLNKMGCDAVPLPESGAQDLSLPEIVFYLQFRYAVTDLIEEVGVNNGDVEVRLRNQINFSNIVRDEIFDSRYHCPMSDSYYNLLIRKIEDMKQENKLSQTWFYDQQLEIFLKKRVESNNFIKKCSVISNQDTRDCMDDLLSEVFVFHGLTLSIKYPNLKNVSFTFSSQKKQPFENMIHIEIEKSTLQYGSIATLSNNNDFPNPAFKGIFISEYLHSKTITFTMQRRQLINHLSLSEGGTKKCTFSVSQSVCARNCYYQQTNFTNFITEVWIEKPEKRPFRGAMNFTLMEECMNECPQSCHQTLFTLATLSEKLLESDSINEAVILQAPQLVLTDKIDEVPIYTWFDFLAETGGYLGLFLGASWLSLYHIIDFLLATLGSFFTKKSS